MHDVLIVGAGLFGSVIRDALRKRGMDVVVVDDMREGAGSLPAACLMKPGWFSKLGAEIVDPALGELHALYGLEELEFTMLGGYSRAKVKWIQPRKILRGADIRATVLEFKRGEDLWVSVLSNGQSIEARSVVLATGFWTNELSHDKVDIKGLAGVAWLWEGQALEDPPFIRVWAPYKQIVGFNRGDGIWVGDGLAIVAKNWQKKYEEESLARCRVAAKKVEMPSQKLFGIRPYSRTQIPCVLEKQDTNFWVATGGAKNGTLAAGWCAARLVEALT